MNNCHKKPSFQEITLELLKVWADHGYVILQGYDVEISSEKLHPNVYNPNILNSVYVQTNRLYPQPEYKYLLQVVSRNAIIDWRYIVKNYCFNFTLPKGDSFLISSRYGSYPVLTFCLVNLSKRIHNVESIYDIPWNSAADNDKLLTYGDVNFEEDRQRNEYLNVLRAKKESDKQIADLETEISNLKRLGLNLVADEYELKLNYLKEIGASKTK